MATYVMGDIHGCYREFRELLTQIKFNPNSDTLYLVGDLINRGPDSSSTLSFIMDHQTTIHAVLGNHDLSFLVYLNGESRLHRGDTYDHLVSHPQCDEFLHYLRHLPLIHYLESFDIAIAHAGIPHFWSIKQAQNLSEEVRNILTTNDTANYDHFIKHLFGNTPNYWDNTLQGLDRLRTIINYFTRMRLLYHNGNLDFSHKDNQYDPKILQPWFTFERSKHNQTKIIFGHWASLGLHNENNTYCIDSGCVWGEYLTVVRVDTPTFEYHQIKRL